MVLFNAATKELTAKIVYYGPGLGGKTTNILYIYDSLPENERGKMLSLNTQTDRTLFFDFLPITLGTVRELKTRIQLYTVPGQVVYDATRKLVLRGADAIVFVADSQAPALDSNKESYQNLIDNLAEQGIDFAKIPHVIQWNKRDTPNALPIDVLDREINRFAAPTFEACAGDGLGVMETLEGISRLVLQSLSDKYGGSPFDDSHPVPAHGPHWQEAMIPPGLEEFGVARPKGGIEAADDGSAVPASTIEVPIVLDRSLLTGPGPFEINVKLLLK
jgi:signal recognition particle receptor subunit beta